MGSLNPYEQESPPPVRELAEPWMVKAMRAQLLTRAREPSRSIRHRVLATLQMHSRNAIGGE